MSMVEFDGVSDEPFETLVKTIEPVPAEVCQRCYERLIRMCLVGHRYLPVVETPLGPSEARRFTPVVRGQEVKWRRDLADCPFSSVHLEDAPPMIEWVGLAR